MTEILKADGNISEEMVSSQAVEILTQGGIIAYPTETFYGLGVDGTNEKAIRKIFTVKGRNFSNPISVIIDKLENLYPLVREVPACAQKLIDVFWPGALTIVFRASNEIPSILTAGSAKIGVRISSHHTAMLIARKLGRPLTATSANLTGGKECASAPEVIRQIGAKIDALVDAGTTAGGKGSTIIDVTSNPPQILREGMIQRIFIESWIDVQ